MVATLEVDFDRAGAVNAPGATDHNIANLRFQNEDTNDQDTAAPITIPTAGTAFAFWKQVFLHCTVAPNTQVDNIRIHTDGTLGWTGCTVQTGDQALTKNSGSSAGYDPGQAAVLTTHDTITSQTSFFTFTSGAPKSIAISEAGSIINATGETSDYCALQLEVGSTAIQGVQATETVTWLYDEI